MLRGISSSLLRLGLAALAVLGAPGSTLAQTTGPCDSPNTCTIWPPSQIPGTVAVNDPNAVELGVKFKPFVNGFITAIRFYKSSSNTGTHIVNLWTGTGTLLIRATAAGESASGWQEVALPSPVLVTANTTYVASYHTNVGAYSADSGYFSSGLLSGPLQALQDGADGGNGVFRYGSTAFPNGTYQSTNYWVDVVFATSLPPDITPPQVKATTPKAGVQNVSVNTSLTATFSEGVDPSTISTATFELHDPAGALVPGKVTYASATQTATFVPINPLGQSTLYTGVVRGGTAGVKDQSGNALVDDVAWTFTTGMSAPPPPTTGPGGPILVVTSAANPFTVYYAEILRAEGLNAFAVSDVSAVTSTSLSAYDVVILGELPLTPAQVTMFSDWVTAGGNLIAMRPDKQLATLLGLSDAAALLPEGYVKVDTSAAPGAGIVSATMQFHGSADLYTLSGASAIASLFSTADIPTPSPAVTVRAVGAAGGQAAAFTYDLARSVVYTRQGNPAWSGQERDGVLPVRSDDLFFGGTEPNFVDLAKVTIPQADEQQRLLANLIGFLNADRKPLPRFWYLPRGLKAAVVMTGDDHANNGTAGRFDIYNSKSAPGCSVDDWECVRATSYIFTQTPLTDEQVAAYRAQGFEIGVHMWMSGLDEGSTASSLACHDYTPTSIDADYTQQLSLFGSTFPGSAARSNRTHCIVWSDYDTQAQVALAHGIRLDTNYYYWPPGWVGNVPGVFTGSGMAQRFAAIDGTLLDIYQATTQMTDESGQLFPFTVDTLLDRALGPEGYYGTFVANMHTDTAVHAGSAAIVASAQSRGVPIISAGQLLDWTDGRNASSFRNITWNGTALSFTVSLWSGTRGIQAMVPIASPGGALAGILNGSVPVDYTVETIKGVDYARFFVSTGSYQARYGADTVAPAISALTLVPAITSARVTWHTNEPATSRIAYGLSPTALVFTSSTAGLTTSHTIDLTGLAGGTTYYYRVTSVDAVNNSASAPTPYGIFTTDPVVALSIGDTTVADFSAGAVDSAAYLAEMGDGELLLKPAVAAEFTGTALPPGWSVVPWAAGGTTTVNGQLVTDGVRAGTDLLFAPGRTLEFAATFSGQAFEHAGFGLTFNETPWAIFSTGAGGAFYARTNSGSASIDTQLPATWLGGQHRFRIDWTSSAVVYWIDGTQVASHAVAIGQDMRVNVSDVTTGGGAVSVDWLRLSPYAPATTFISRVLDSNAVTQWANVAWTSSVPAGTSLVISARFGDTPAPDDTWTPFTVLSGSGAVVTQSSRFVQYRAVLTGDGSATPAVESVTFTASSPAPSISVDDVTVTEGDTATIIAAFTLTLSSPMAVPVSVSYATANDTAGGSDYVATSGTAVFNPGVTSVTVPVAVKGDALIEATEGFFLNLTNSVGAPIADPQGRCTIIDNDLTLITIADASVVEGNAGTTSATFVVSLSRAIPQTVTVDYATSPATASADSDYTTTSGTLTFASGTVQQSIVVPVIGDSLDEPSETFLVTLSGAVNGTITTGQATGTITDDDAVVTVSVADLTITEGSGGTVTAQVPVTLSSASGQTVSVGFTMAAVTATAGSDYTSSSGTVTFPAGSTSQVISVPIITDLMFEADETFRVTLRTPVNATIARTQATVTILNDDPVPQVSIGNVSVTEGNTGSVNANFPVTLSNPSSSIITVNYQTADGTAVAGVDYTAASGQVSFSAGAASRTISVPVPGDTLDEPNKTFVVNLSAPVNATIATAQGTGTIVDNDPTPSFRISDTTVTETDSGSVNTVLTVTLSAASSLTTTVNYATGTTGTATPSVDFTPVSGALSFAPGVTSQQITVPVIGDVINEANETVHVDLTAPVNATIADSRGVVTIVENDPLPTINVSDISVAEGNSGTKTATFTFTLSAVSSRAVRFTYATANGTATAGTDYTARNGTLTFNAGVTTLTLAITVRGDAVLEPDETVLLNLSAPVSGVLARPSATLTILNDDQ